MAVALPWIAAAFTAVSAIQQGQAAKKAGEYNAAVATRNAGIARDQANADAAAQQRMALQKIGAARAGYAASGVTSEGSPLDVLSMSAANAELDKQNILYKGELRAMGYEDTAALELSRGKAAETTGFVKAGAALFNTAGNVYANKPTTTAQTGYKISDYEDPGY